MHPGGKKRERFFKVVLFKQIDDKVLHLRAVNVSSPLQEVAEQEALPLKWNSSICLPKEFLDHFKNSPSADNWLVILMKINFYIATI